MRKDSVTSWARAAFIPMVVFLPACRAPATPTSERTSGSTQLPSGSSASASSDASSRPSPGLAGSSDGSKEPTTTTAEPTSDPRPAQPAGQDAGQRAQQVRTFVADFDEASRRWNETWAALATDAERPAFLKQNPSPHNRAAAWLPRIAPLVEADPTDAAACTALVWTATHVFPERTHALGLLARYHLQNREIVPLCATLESDSQPRAQAFLESVMAESHLREAQGFACYALARGLLARALNIEHLLAVYPKDGDSSLRSAQDRRAEIEELRGRAETLYEQVAAEFADLGHLDTTLGEAANKNLFEMRALAVGKPAPEITGEDIAGVAFKLSDYRGKIVLLDFWGFW